MLLLRKALSALGAGSAMQSGAPAFGTQGTPPRQRHCSPATSKAIEHWGTLHLPLSRVPSLCTRPFVLLGSFQRNRSRRKPAVCLQGLLSQPGRATESQAVRMHPCVSALPSRPMWLCGFMDSESALSLSLCPLFPDTPDPCLISAKASGHPTRPQTGSLPQRGPNHLSRALKLPVWVTKPRCDPTGVAGDPCWGRPGSGIWRPGSVGPLRAASSVPGTCGGYVLGSQKEAWSYPQGKTLPWHWTPLLQECLVSPGGSCGHGLLGDGRKRCFGRNRERWWKVHMWSTSLETA